MVALKIQDKFYQFGTAVRLDDGFLRSLYNDYHDSLVRFIVILNRWKDNDPDTYTWSTVINVLQSDAIGAYAVAQDVKKHLATKAETSTCKYFPNFYCVNDIQNLISEIIAELVPQQKNNDQITTG